MTVNDILVGGQADDVWEERWNALSLEIDTMFKDYGQVPDASRLMTLRPMLLCLKAFAGKRFDAFHSGFLSKQLETWPDFPPDAVFSAVQDQIGFDVDVINRAILQRVSGTSLMKERLALADRLAWSALQLAVSAGLLQPDKESTATTYFQKSPNIRVIPYAPVALVSVPYSSQQLDRDLLATPHEVGHYVFWHGVYGTGSLREHLVKQLGQIVDENSSDYALLLNWLEEIFADVYGTCVAGPVMALDFQDLQLHASRQKFITDDGQHPAPVLRPHIHLQTLRKRDLADWGVWAAVLLQYWDVRLQDRQRIDHLDALDPTDRTSKLDHFVRNNRSITVAETISGSADSSEDVKPLDHLVTVMLDVLKSGNAHPWYNTLPGVSAAEAQSLDPDTLAQTTEQLYAAFQDFVLHPPAVDPDRLDPLHAAPLSTPADQSNVVGEWLDPTNLTFPLPDNPGEPVSFKKWKPYFEAKGWTTEGPDAKWP